MTKKTRVRVARIAAGAVVAAGASLMVAGVAQADPILPDPSCGIIGTDPDCEDDGGGENPDNPGEPGNGGENPDNPGEPGNGGENPGEPGNGGENPEEPGNGGENPEEPGNGGEDPVEEPTEKPTTPGGDKGGDDDAGTTPAGGNGPAAQEQGSSALTDTGDAPATSAQGSGDELAETGAAETTFLVIGAATMIAGGIGFRVLPRLMTGRGGAAA
ncbi:hypothetical protein [Streptomyces sp. NPDC055058]